MFKYAVYTFLNKSTVHTVDCPSFVARNPNTLPDKYWHPKLYEASEEARQRADEAAKKGGQDVYHVAGCQRCGTTRDLALGN